MTMIDTPKRRYTRLGAIVAVAATGLCDAKDQRGNAAIIAKSRTARDAPLVLIGCECITRRAIDPRLWRLLRSERTLETGSSVGRFDSSTSHRPSPRA